MYLLFIRSWVHVVITNYNFIINIGFEFNFSNLNYSNSKNPPILKSCSLILYRMIIIVHLCYYYVTKIWFLLQMRFPINELERINIEFKLS